MTRSGIFFILLLLGSIIISDNAYSQLNRRQIKRNNKAASSFKGQKGLFPKSKQYSTIGVSINAMNYLGDITPTASAISTDISFTRPGFSIWGSHRVGARYTVEAAYSWGTITGSDFVSANPDDESDVYRYIRNLSFRNRIHELSAVFVVDYKENNGQYISRVQFTPYAFIGISGFHHNPQAMVNEESSLPEAGQWVDLRPLGTEGQNSDQYDLKPYSLWQAAIPFGLGIRYRFNQVMDASFQIGIRYLFFDYVDDVSGNYVDLGAFGNDELARELSDRSQEQTSARNNEPRNFTVIDQFTNSQTYVGSDGRTYDVFAGYGSDTHPSNIRGNTKDNDLFVYTQIRVSYIIGGSFRRAKYR